MPNYRGHVAGGAIMFAAVYSVLRAANPSYSTLFEWFGCTILGALFPDIDTKSKGQKIWYSLLVGFLLFLALQQRFKTMAGLSLIAFLPLLGRHRGITHSIVWIAAGSFCVVISAFFALPQYATIIAFDTFFFFAGAVSHIALDRLFTRLKRMGLMAR